jgi:hypothetical protein
MRDHVRVTTTAFDKLLEKLDQIQQLWSELRRTKPKANTPEYETLVKKIGVLSSEYQVLVDAIKKPENPKVH